ncbi:MAG: DinB family protein [Acidobacteria bacterium]|nr:DinB family protein [Acidobacteriota bacterium]
MKRTASALVLTALVLATSFAAAQTVVTGFRAEFYAQQDGVEKELLGLAEATPPEKFGWRPAEGVRSVSEVYMHLVGANYMLPSFNGVKAPEGISPGMEKSVTEKAAVIAEMKKSFEHLRSAIASTKDADLDKPVKFFGRDSTVRGLYLTVANHEHEHLGQSIAYARMNGIVPPWSQPKAKPAEKPAEKK